MGEGVLARFWSAGQGRSLPAAATVLFLLVHTAWAQAPARGIPRTSDGKPDLNGVWQTLSTAAWDLEDHNGAFGVHAGQSVVEGGEIPYQASARQEEPKLSEP